MIDISWPISPKMTAYKDKGSVAFVETRSFSCSAVRESLVRFSTHTGTHIDAPSHMLEDGATSESLQPLVGACRVLDVTYVKQAITAADLEPFKIKKGEIVLLKTKNSERSVTERFWSEFVYLEASGAEYLASLEVKAVGIDYLGIERGQEGHPTHKALLNASVVVIEGLRLQEAVKEKYILYCFPLLLVGVDGAPARAMLE